MTTNEKKEACIKKSQRTSQKIIKNARINDASAALLLAEVVTRAI